MQVLPCQAKVQPKTEEMRCAAADKSTTITNDMPPSPRRERNPQRKQSAGEEGKTVRWTVLPWETLAGGLPMGVRSTSMTAQSNSSNQTLIYNLDRKKQERIQKIRSCKEHFYYPTKPERSRPSVKCFCKKQYITKIGAIVSKHPDSSQTIFFRVPTCALLNS